VIDAQPDFSVAECRSSHSARGSSRLVYRSSGFERFIEKLPPRDTMRAIVPLLLVASVAACHHAASTAVKPAGRAAASRVPAAVTPSAIALGDTVFHTTSCYRCHGPDAKGTARAPNLTDSTWIHIDGSYDAIVALVTTGFTKAEQKDPQYQFTMNPRGGMRLTDDQIKAVAAYVWSISHRGEGR